MTDDEFITGTRLDPEDRDLEAPAADAVEQATPYDPADQDTKVERGPEVSEWDAVEQAHVVDVSDEY